MIQPSGPRHWPGRALPRPALLGGAAALLLVVLFGALVQAGVLSPAFRAGSSLGGGGNYYFTSIDNASWRAWTVTVSFADGRGTATIPPIGTVRVHLFDSKQLASEDVDPVDETTVSAGGQFGIGITVERASCDIAAGAPGRVFVGVNVPVPVLLTVATPLGSRTIPETVVAECLRAYQVPGAR